MAKGYIISGRMLSDLGCPDDDAIHSSVAAWLNEHESGADEMPLYCIHFLQRIRDSKVQPAARPRSRAP
eukprot:11035767-Karenia_brevis.AAC.1